MEKQETIICRLCLKICDNFKAIEGDIILEDMIKLCIPELDLSIIKKPIICAPCHGSLENCFHFVTNCLIVEEKIDKYCETLDINNKSQINLSSLLQFSLTDVNTAEVDGNSVDVIKVEEQFSEERENTDEKEIGNEHGIFKLEQSFADVENAEQEVEYKNKTLMDLDGMKFKEEEQFTPENMLVCKEESNNPDVIKTEEAFCGQNEIKVENLVEMEDQKFLFNEEVKLDAPDFYRLEDGVIPQQEDSNVTMYQCECCSFQTKYKEKFKTHTRLHKKPSEITMYQCESCSYQTRHKDSLRIHMVVHKDPSEITMYKCEYCSFQSKRKGGLKRHLLLHTNRSGATMYKCESCSFQTKYKPYLKMHLSMLKNHSDLTLKDHSELTSYQIERKWDRNLRTYSRKRNNT